MKAANTVPLFRWARSMNAMKEKPQSMLLPILAAVVLAGLGRMVIQRIREDRRAAGAAREDLGQKVSEVMRGRR